MNPKEIIIAILGVLIPIVYTAITNRFPDFPIDAGTFLAFILWFFEKVVFTTGIYFSSKWVLHKKGQLK